MRGVRSLSKLEVEWKGVDKERKENVLRLIGMDLREGN